MTNRIRDVYVVNHRLDPHETELRLHVEVETLTPTTEIKGKLLGPRSAYASTVEIAYPLREVARDGHIEMRVVIPEACWWEPKTPFLYHGVLELWQDSERCERIDISHGIRWLQQTSTGLRLNGRPLVLRGKVIEQPCDDAELQEMRAQGFNTVMFILRTPDAGPWKLANQHGLFVLPRTAVASHIRMLNLQVHWNASAFGWVADGRILDEALIMMTKHGHWFLSNQWYGLEPGASVISRHASFVIGPEEQLSHVGLPKIVIAQHLPEPLPSHADVIGWIESS